MVVIKEAFLGAFFLVSTEKFGVFELGGHVEDAPALWAMDNASSCSDLDGGLGGHFHVAAHAHFMFEGRDSDPMLRFEKVEVNVSDAFVKKLGEPVVFAFEFRDAGFQVVFFALEPREEVFYFAALLGVGFFRGNDLRVESFEFFHQVELPVFQGGDGSFGSFDFVGKGGVFLVFPRLELLLLVAPDGIALGTGFHFQGPPFNLYLFGTGFCLVEPSGGVGELLFPRLALFGQVGNLSLEASKALVSILQGEQLFDDIKHRRMMIGPSKIIQRSV
jgi:hypothetical protein